MSYQLGDRRDRRPSPASASSRARSAPRAALRRPSSRRAGSPVRRAAAQRRIAQRRTIGISQMGIAACVAFEHGIADVVQRRAVFPDGQARAPPAMVGCPCSVFPGTVKGGALSADRQSRRRLSRSNPRLDGESRGLPRPDEACKPLKIIRSRENANVDVDHIQKLPVIAIISANHASNRGCSWGYLRLKDLVVAVPQIERNWTAHARQPLQT
jgi:hypothetical protein